MLNKFKTGLHKMTSTLNQTSDNSILGETGGSKVPTDGTGKPSTISPETWADYYRRRTTRSLALTIQRRPPKQIQPCPEMDKDD